MNLADFNISLRKIQNGYVISYPLPKKKKNGKQYEEQEAQQYTSFGFFAISTGAPAQDRAEWYCATEAQVKEVLPRLVMECYAGSVTLKDE